MTDELKFESGPVKKRDGEFISDKAEARAAAKKQYTATRLADLECCPIDQPFTHCMVCTFTSQVGFCFHPVDIQTEIEAGRARPMVHSYRWPEREEDFAKRERERIEVLKQRAFGRVDSR